MKICGHCGALNTTTAYSDCYKCGKKLPAGGSVKIPRHGGDGRTMTSTNRDTYEKAQVAPDRQV